MFDLFVLTLDYGYLMLSADIVLLRFVRILRVVRLIRTSSAASKMCACVNFC